MRRVEDVFQLTDGFRQPILLLDGADAEPRIVFATKALDSERSVDRTAFRNQVPKNTGVCHSVR